EGRQRRSRSGRGRARGRLHGEPGWRQVQGTRRTRRESTHAVKVALRIELLVNEPRERGELVLVEIAHQRVTERPVDPIEHRRAAFLCKTERRVGIRRLAPHYQGEALALGVLVHQQRNW